MQPFVIPQHTIHQQILNYDPAVKCDQFHLGTCDQKFFQQFLSTATNTHKLYLIVHLVSLILRFKKIKKK